MRLGAFKLVSFLARGGIGEVWQARHERFGAPVAIKVLNSAAEHGASLLQEVGATAALDHPHIIRVLDVGEVPPDIAARSAGWLEPGAPWMAMEMASGGSLTQVGRELQTWSAARGVLVALLEALAHAHARGFVHLDVKPGNVMFCAQREPRPGPKLTDFGLARALNRPADLSQPVAGTPSVMAPEQWRGRWREIGPCTDLYGLGCLAWWLLTGRSVFEQTGIDALARAHCAEEPGLFLPRFSVPPGTETWLRWLLAKSAAHRADRASDARSALLALGDADPGWTPARHSYSFVEPHAHTHADLGDSLRAALEPPPRPTTMDVTTLIRLSEVAVLDGEGAIPARPAVPAATLPPDWRIPDHPQPFERMTGVSLLMLRTVPVVGHQAARDELWAALGETLASQRPRLVILRGLTGYGKTRLAGWLAERAHTLGVAEIFRGNGKHSSTGRCPIGTLLLERLRAKAEGPEAVRQEIEALLKPGVGVVGPLMDILLPLLTDLEAETPVVPSASQEEMGRAILALLTRLRGDRAGLMLLDDAHLSRPLLSFGAGFLATPEAGPMLVVLCVDDAALVEQEAVARQIDALSQREGARVVAVGPLPPQDWPALADAVLHLDPELRRRLCLHAAGSPAVITQVAGDWLEAGWIEAGDDGLFRAPRGEPPLPLDLRAIWASRLRRALVSRIPDDLRAIELAATFSHEVHDSRWARACELDGLEVSPGLVQGLERAGLIWRATPDASTWMFAHNFVRELLVERARVAGRWERANLVAAEAIGTGWRRNVQLAQAYGVHMTEAGAHEAAIEPLYWAAVRSHRQGAVQHADGLLNLWAGAMNRAQVPSTDPRWGTGLVLRAGLYAERSNWEAAFQLLDQLEATGRACGWGDALVDVLRFRSQLGTLRGLPLEHNLAAAEEAVAIARARGGPVRLGLSLVSLALARMGMERPEAAIGCLREAITLFEAHDDPDLLARTLQTLGNALLRLGREVEAQAALEIAAERLAGRGLSSESAMSLRLLAQLAVERGDLDVAERHIEAALRQLTEVGGLRLVRAQDLLARVHLARGRLDEARATVEEALPHVMFGGLVIEEAGLRALLALIAARLADGALWSSSLDALGDVIMRAPGQPLPDPRGRLSEAVDAASAIGLPLERALHLLAALDGRRTSAGPESRPAEAQPDAQTAP